MNRTNIFHTDTCAKHRDRKFGFLFLSVLLFGIAGQSAGLDTVRLSGSYTHALSKKTNTFHFEASLASHKWRISATNANKPDDWSEIRYDGTNIYALVTDVGNPGSEGRKFPTYGYIYPGEFYLPHVQDSVHIFFPWLVFCLTPELANHFERNGVFDIPLPWGNVRYSPAAYGFRWNIELPQDGSVIKRIDFVRDSSLDLSSDEEELHRPSLNYPFSLAWRNDLLEVLNSRKSIPDGFIRGTYTCQTVYKTNGHHFPGSAQLAVYFPNVKGHTTIPLDVLNLKLAEIKLSSDMETQTGVVSAKTFVMDFRFQATNETTKFNFAKYTLEPGEYFKSAQDAELQSDADHWLKHGPKFGSHNSKRRTILIGLLMITLIPVGLFVFRSKLKNKQTQSAI